MLFIKKRQRLQEKLSRFLIKKKKTSFSPSSDRFLIDCIKNFSRKYDVCLEFFSDTWLIKLQKNNLIRFISAYTLDLNSAAATQVCQNKYEVCQVLHAACIPHIKHHCFFSSSVPWAPQKKTQELNLLKLFFLYNKQIVLKPSIGTGGKDVFFIQTKRKLLKTSLLLCKKYSSITLSPFYNFSYEYRVIILNKEVQICYKKERPHIIGNGKSTLYTLIKNKKKFYSISSTRLLLKNFLKLFSIPPAEKVINIYWKHNLSKGAKAHFDIPTSLKLQLEELSLKTLEALNMNFASVDIAQTPNGLKIIEVNSGVMMEELNRQSSPSIKITLSSIYEKAFCQMLGIKEHL